jgi:hypothetical protein
MENVCHAWKKQKACLNFWLEILHGRQACTWYDDLKMDIRIIEEIIKFILLGRFVHIMHIHNMHTAFQSTDFMLYGGNVKILLIF